MKTLRSVLVCLLAVALFGCDSAPDAGTAEPLAKPLLQAPGHVLNSVRLVACRGARGAASYDCEFDVTSTQGRFNLMSPSTSRRVVRLVKDDAGSWSAVGTN